MEKLKKALEDHSEDSERAEQIYMETYELDERELADYVSLHDDELRELLGVQDIASKDGNPELASAYFKLKQNGDAARNPDPYTRKDYYSGDIRGIDYFLEKLGVPKEGGSYTDDIRSRYTNPKSKDYVGNWKDEALINTKAQEDSQDADSWMADMRRAAYDYQRMNQARGYDADNGVRLGAWTGDALESLILPRMREARLMGKDFEMKDMFGDIAELGLNFVPGVGIVSKSGKVVADMNRLKAMATKAGAYVADFGAVPLGSQAYDWVAYDREDPRGQWDWGRVAGQATANAAGIGMLKGAGVGVGAKMAGGAGGDVAEKGFRQNAGQFVKDIYYKTDDAIAARQAQLDNLAEGARLRKNVRLEGQADISGANSPDDLIDADNYRILTGEAERLKKSQKARGRYQDEQAKWDADVQSQVRDELRMSTGGTERQLAEQADVKRLAGAKDSYRQANEAGAREIVQLPDGRFVYAEHVVDTQGRPVQFSALNPETGAIPIDYSLRFPGAQYDVRVPEGTKPAVFRYGREQGTGVDRNQAVEAAILSGKEQAIKRKYQAGTFNTPKAETLRDFGASAVANAAAREGMLPAMLGSFGSDKQSLAEKRQTALWNRQLGKLRTSVVDKAVSPEDRRNRIDAVMNVLHFGLDNIPEDMFRRNSSIYHIIARELGAKDWKHWSETKVKDYPTTSMSTAAEYFPTEI